MNKIHDPLKKLMETEPDFEKIRAAFLTLMEACNLEGESGTENLYQILKYALKRVDWKIVKQSHREGLSYDVSYLMAEAVVNEIKSVYFIEE